MIRRIWLALAVSAALAAGCTSSPTESAEQPTSTVGGPETVEVWISVSDAVPLTKGFGAERDEEPGAPCGRIALLDSYAPYSEMITGAQVVIRNAAGEIVGQEPLPEGKVEIHKTGADGLLVCRFEMEFEVASTSEFYELEIGRETLGVPEQSSQENLVLRL